MGNLSVMVRQSDAFPPPRASSHAGPKVSSASVSKDRPACRESLYRRREPTRCAEAPGLVGRKEDWEEKSLETGCQRWRKKGGRPDTD